VPLFRNQTHEFTDGINPTLKVVDFSYNLKKETIILVKVFVKEFIRDKYYIKPLFFKQINNSKTNLHVSIRMEPSWLSQLIL